MFNRNKKAYSKRDEYVVKANRFSIINSDYNVVIEMAIQRMKIINKLALELLDEIDGLLKGVNYEKSRMESD